MSPVYQPPAASGGGAVATDVIWDTKGDLAAATGADAASKLAVGSDGQVLTADSAQSTGIKWAAAASWPVGTSLPGSPADGDEYYYVADATLGIVWHLKYRSASGSTYKWEFVGGPPLTHEINNAAYPGASETASSATYVDLSTVGPSVTCPLAGDYIILFGAVGNQGSPGDGLMSFAIGGAAANDAESQFMNGVGYTAREKLVRRNVPSASSALVCKYRRTSSANTDYRGRWMHVTPVRVI